jgi:heme a synthase
MSGPYSPHVIRISPQRYRAITLASVVALIGIIITGAAVRLTGSGLGCTDWPTCEQNQFHADLEWHPMIEFVNRLITGIVSLAVIAAVLGSLRRTPRRRDLTRLSLGLVAGVIAQILIGALVVKLELLPATVALHYLVSIVLVVNALVLHWRASHDGPVTRVVPSSLARCGWVLSLLGIGVLVLGTVVTGAGPHAGDEDVERLDLSLRTATQLHSVMVWLLVAATLTTYWYASKRAGAPPVLMDRLQLLILALGVQGGIGYVQYFADVPAGLVAAHVAGSVAVVVCIVRVVFAAYAESSNADAEMTPSRSTELLAESF